MVTVMVMVVVVAGWVVVVVMMRKTAMMVVSMPPVPFFSGAVPKLFPCRGHCPVSSLSH